MNHRLSSLVLALVLLSLALSPMAASQPSGQDLEGVFIARVYYATAEDLRLLSSYDLLEYNNHENKYVLAILDAADLVSLAALGFHVAVDSAQTASLTEPRAVDPDQADAIPGFACYRTVEEIYAGRRSPGRGAP